MPDSGLSKHLPALDLSKAQDLLKWLAAGFALAAALTTFFGIKDGVLASVVRTNPGATLWALAMIGFAVLFALVVPALATENESGMVKPWVLLLSLTGIVAATSAFAPDLPAGRPQPPWPLLAGIVIVGVVLTMLTARLLRSALKWSFVILVLAIACLCAGLWTVARVSVERTMRLEAAAVVSSVSTTEGRTAITIAASGADLAGPVRVRVDGIDTASTSTVLAETVLMPSRTGDLAATTTIPIDAGSYSTVKVLTCQEWNRNTDRTADCEPSELNLLFTPAAPQAALVGSLTTTDDNTRVQFALDASGLTPGSSVKVQVGPGEQPAASVRLWVAADGRATWRSQAPASAGSWSLRAIVCSEPGLESPCTDDWVDLASLQVD